MGSRQKNKKKAVLRPSFRIFAALNENSKTRNMLSFIQFFTFQRQLILFFACLALTLGLWPTVGFAWAWMPLLVVIILLVKHFLIGTVNAAAMKMQIGDTEGAEKVLAYTFKPEWLQFGYHGMYYFIRSGLALQKGETKKCEKLANQAMKLDLPDDIRGMLYLQLINVQGMYAQKMTTETQRRPYVMKMKEYLETAKKLNINNPQVKENIKEIDLMLKGQHQMQRQAMKGGRGGMKGQMQGYMKRGGGRKRR